MKALLVTLPIAVVLGFVAPAIAGPNVGQVSHGTRAIKQMRDARELRDQAGPYALTGDREEAGDYCWRATLKWVGPHKYRRVVFERVPVE